MALTAIMVLGTKGVQQTQLRPTVPAWTVSAANSESGGLGDKSLNPSESQCLHLESGEQILTCLTGRLDALEWTCSTAPGVQTVLKQPTLSQL